MSELKRKVRDSMRNSFIADNIKHDVAGYSQATPAELYGKPQPQQPPNSNPGSSIKLNRGTASATVVQDENSVEKKQPSLQQEPEGSVDGADQNSDNGNVSGDGSAKRPKKKILK
jgi:hypothetical protein